MGNTVRDIVKKIVTAKQLDLVPTAFDRVGDIIVFAYFPDELAKKEKKIGQAILEHHRGVTGVFKKVGEYGGKYRTPKLQCIAGDPSTETIHKEHACRIFLDVEKVYFSARLSTERKRIFELIKKNEQVLCMFSGCGVYPVTMAKNSAVGHVWGVEVNPTGHQYALKNVEKNKVADKISLFKGDARKIVPTIDHTFDRILMPLPKEAELFLDVALSKSKKGTKIHLYHFCNEDEIDEFSNKVVSMGKEFGYRLKIKDIVRAGSSSPHVYRYCVDITVQAVL